MRFTDTAIPGVPNGRRFTAVAMPNPHLVTFVEAVDEGTLAKIVVPDGTADVAVNALNDVFAMGGAPLLALSVTAFPEELPLETAGALRDFFAG